MDDRQGHPPEMPSFEDFYEAVNERSPFPWQACLARQVSEQGKWPAEIGVPTGLGKTACLDIAVWWLASQAHLPTTARSAPTRIWWVVNRRLLVDEASKHAEHLKEMLRHPTTGHRAHHPQDVLARVAARLRSLTGSLGGEPVHVVPMRGGITLRRPPNPAQPSVIVSTIPMYGSRLLFRGFGSSRYMRPIDAALAGTDSLVLVDEAHLARHLRDLIPKLQQCTPESTRSLLPARRSAPQVVSLTATGDTPAESRFELDADDLEDPEVHQRLHAAKPVRVDAEPRGDAATALRDAAAGLLSKASSPASCVIFCNTPSVARAVHDDLAKSTQLGAEADLMLVTGRARQHEAEELRDRLLSSATGAPARRDVNGPSPARERHLVVVATQTLEVGADLDFEYLVTEQCGVRAVTQRLGRLNRLGLHDHAHAVYVHRPPPKRSRSSSRDNEDAESHSASNGWPIYGTEPSLVLERLKNQSFDDHIDLSPRVIAQRLGEPGDDPGRAPEVLPDLLWEWVKTTTPPHGAAPVEPYFSGIAEPERSVSVVWRAYVPAANESRLDDQSDEADVAETSIEQLRLWPRVSQDEIAEVPLHELRRALRDRNVELIVRRRTDESTFETAPLRDLEPRNLVVLPIDKGMYDGFGWAPDEYGRVSDLSIQNSGLPLDRSALKRLLRRELSAEEETALNQTLRGLRGSPDGSGDVDEQAAREGAESLLALLLASDDPPLEAGSWEEVLPRLADTVRDGDGLVAPLGEVARIEIAESPNAARIDEDDEGSLCHSLPPEAMQLAAHGRAVGERIRNLATALGLSATLVEVAARAGHLHDIGKADARFQQWLNPGATALMNNPGYMPLAKSDMPRSRWPRARAEAGWPRGGRHEELSARLVKQWMATSGQELDDHERDLLVHLVVSHHGRGRPLVVPVADLPAAPLEWRFADGQDVSVSADLSVADWDQPARFRRLNEQYGPWGVALLEAVVRQADHEVSDGATSTSSVPESASTEVQ